MRDSGAPATTAPMLSASVQVTPGMAYTIVSMGPASHLGGPLQLGSYTGFLALSPAGRTRAACGSTACRTRWAAGHRAGAGACLSNIVVYAAQIRGQRG